MKITYLIQAYPPMICGAASFAQSLAEDLAEKGHTILVIAASDTGKTYTTKKGNLTVVRLKSTHNPARVGQRFVGWGFKSVRRLIREFSPDVIHSHDSLNMGFAAMMEGRRIEATSIFTLHQLPWFVSAYLPKIRILQNSVEKALWMYSRFLNRMGVTMIVQNQSISDVVIQNGGFVPTIVPYGIHLSTFSPEPLPLGESGRLCQKYGLDPTRPVILHVGRLDTDKQVHLVIMAAAKAIRNTNAQLLVLGDGSQRKRLIEITERFGISEHCHFPGYVSPKVELPLLYRLGDIFVTASEIETQGLVVLEAMASGLPIVAARATCIPEVVRQGENGFLFTPKNVEEMAERIVDLVRDPDLRDCMGYAGLQIVRSQDRNVSIELHENLYRKLLLQTSTQQGQSRTDRVRQSQKVKFANRGNYIKNE